MGTKMICIDPGINGCGLAFFAEERLTAACYVRNPGEGWLLPDRVRAMVDALKAVALPDISGRRLVTERPQIYSYGKGKGNPNDLIALAEICAGFASHWSGPWETVLPRTWKGNIDGDAMTERIRDRLSIAEERNVKHAGALDHNIYDAVGIGLWKLGRLGKKRVIAR